MNSKNSSMVSANISGELSTNLTAFEKDVQLLLTGLKAGHMECWEYGSALSFGDAAGGANLWQCLMKNSGNYYVPDSDSDVLRYMSKQSYVNNIFSGYHNVVELGPGSIEAIRSKTAIFIDSLSMIDSYTAVDISREQAQCGAAEIARIFPINTTYVKSNFSDNYLPLKHRGKAVFVMWGISVGNISGTANNNPILMLTRNLQRYKANMKKEDLFVFSFDTEQNEDVVVKAYSEPMLKSSVLSSLHRFNRDIPHSGNFNPDLWRHEAVWYSDVGQCAHVVFPIADQYLKVNSQEIFVPAWKRFIANNSYKFSVDTMVNAVTNAGMQPLECIKSKGNSVALMVAKCVR